MSQLAPHQSDLDSPDSAARSVALADRDLYDGVLAAKCALITGAASGIGRATALLFARAGAAVAVVDLDQAGARAVAQAIRADGGRAISVACDVSQSADCQRAVDRTVDELGGLDILFNNAGVIRRANVLATTEEEWDRVMAVNAKSVFLMSKYAIPVMKKAGGGVIINTASGWGLVGGVDAIAYCASKAAVVNMTRAMAIDHGPQNIRVNCVCPGDTDTGMLREEARQLGVSDALFLAQAGDRPLQRIGRPEDVAQAVLYLASDASAFVSGAALVVDGGGLAG
jgi:NAD(P)-dependent dehydrogenase (short-subunit alcohol dehydrogenase family)